MGSCYSSGGLLLLSGHKRLVFANTTFLLHDGYTGDNNSLGKVLDKVKFTEKIENKVRDYVISRTKITKNMYNKKYREDWYIFADEMVELGIADEVIADINQIM
jgi:ATP-dependent protease ClpP protease subunit